MRQSHGLRGLLRHWLQVQDVLEGQHQEGEEEGQGHAEPARVPEEEEEMRGGRKAERDRHELQTGKRTIYEFLDRIRGKICCQLFF